MMAAASEPAPGSVWRAPPAAGRARVRGGTHRRFCSSVPSSRTAPAKNPRPLITADTPVSPQVSSSVTRQAVSRLSMPPPPYASGMSMLARPSSAALEDLPRELLGGLVVRRHGTDLALGELVRDGRAPAGRRSAWSAPRPLSIGRYVFRSVDLKQAELRRQAGSGQLVPAGTVVPIAHVGRTTVIRPSRTPDPQRTRRLRAPRGLDDLARTLAQEMPRRRALRVIAGAVAAAAVPGVARPAGRPPAGSRSSTPATSRWPSEVGSTAPRPPRPASRRAVRATGSARSGRWARTAARASPSAATPAIP